MTRHLKHISDVKDNVTKNKHMEKGLGGVEAVLGAEENYETLTDILKAEREVREG